MKAVQLVQPGHPLEARELPVPATRANDILVRVKAAGICHSDAHYRAGVSPVQPLPMTLGHEVAGIVEAVGEEVRNFRPGDRVCLHYLVTCGECHYCRQGTEQFCRTGAMIGKTRPGGYAEYISLPARSAFKLPEEISFKQGAVMMCSSATSLHALNKARLRPGESCAVFGVGGLGFSALQLAGIFGAGKLLAVDINPERLNVAESMGAIPIDARDKDPVARIREITGGKGIDVALELIGLPETMRQAVRSLAPFGRAVLAGITDKNFEVSSYTDLINREAEIIGVSDHLAAEIPQLINYVKTGQLNLSQGITESIPLDAGSINATLDRLDDYGHGIRTVIVP